LRNLINGDVLDSEGETEVILCVWTIRKYAVMPASLE